MSFSVVMIIMIAVFLFSSAAVALLISVYARKGHFDQPNHRSMHTEAIPTGAGIVIALIMIAGFIGVYYFWSAPSLLYAAGITTVLAAIGWWDDKRFMPPKARLLLFFALAVCLVSLVGQVDEIQLNSSQTLKIPFVLAILLTAVGFVWVVNLYNFMDGMDGLAALQTIIAAAFFANWFFHAGNDALMIVCLLVIAASLGFLVFNWSPAKVFMGDVGSLPIGGFFAIMTVVGVSQYNFSVIGCALLIGVFVFDATFTVLRRLIMGEKVFEAHRSHLYQRLANCQVPHWIIVLINGCFMLLLASLAEASRLGMLSPLEAGVIGLISVLLIIVWVVVIEKRVKST